MKVLFIAPIPPPINGQSKASKMLLDALTEKNDVQVVDLKKSSLKNGLFSLSRLKDIGKIIKQIKKHEKGVDILYFSISESFLGNMKDILVYFFCRRSLDKTYIHLLGGTGMRQILAKNNWQQKLNAYYIKRLRGVILEGSVDFKLYNQIIPANKIHIVPNFAEDYLFVSDEEINKKFSAGKPIKIVYLSNLISGKGYEELLGAYSSLTKEEQEMISIDFAGSFDNPKSEELFVNAISSFPLIKYWGFIDGNQKRELLSQSHVFCLPTYYPFEGQPLSILEAFASGCVVITTNHSGIPFVFQDGVNGFAVEKKSVPAIVTALRKLITEFDELKQIAVANRNEALNKYTANHFQQSLLCLFETNALPAQ